jgi:hypothetical protein
VLTIGCQNQTTPATGAMFFFNGTIDEVRIYNRALSQQEIQVDMVPEFSTSLIMPLFMTATLLAVIVYGRKQKRS